jgi:hypothetical protein
MALTKVNLLQNVNFGIDYDHTRSFTTEGEQETYFLSKIPAPTSRYSKSNLTYQRKERRIVWGENVDAMFDVSYLMFKNEDSGSNKWFYAFITDIEYLSKNSCYIYFTVDVVQTWLLFDIDIPSAYIERQHTPTDVIGEHLIDEGLATGDYIIRATDTFSDLNEQAIIVASTWDPNSGGSVVIGEVYTGIFSGTKYFAFNRSTGIVALKLFLNEVVVDAKTDAITGIFMIPLNLLPSFSDGDAISVPNALTVSKSQDKNELDIDGYTPRNNKLFVYPYNLLYVSNHNGAVAEYKLEYFSTPTMEFFATCNVSQNPIVTLVPNNYKGAVANFDETLRMGDYAQCSWVVDSFTQYLADAVVSAPMNMASGMLGVGVSNVGAKVPKPIGLGAISAGVEYVAGGVQALRQADHVRGAVSGGLNTAIGIQTFGFYPKTIRSEFAEIIDNHFTKYGYRVNSLEEPAIKTRKAFNYLKFQEMNIEGNVTNEVKQKINEIFKKGITFWHNDNIGDYSQDNTPI